MGIFIGKFSKVAGTASARVKIARIGGALAALALAGAGIAAAASDAPGRYSMSPADGGGMIRLDTQTGAMSLCKRELQDQWSCAEMKDQQHASASDKDQQHASANDELERLREENKALKEQVDRLEETLGINEDAAGEPKSGMKLSLPSEADVDKAFDYLERMFDKLHERVERLQRRHPPAGDGTAL